MVEFLVLIVFILIITIILVGGFIFLAEWDPKPKRTYVVTWRYNSFCPNMTVIVEAKSLVKAWKKVQKQHSIPIDLVSIKEI